MHQGCVMFDRREELKDRVEARKHELLAKYNRLKADSRHEAAEARDRVKEQLDELEAHLKSGWNDVSDEVLMRLNKWLDKDRETRE